MRKLKIYDNIYNIKNKDRFDYSKSKETITKKHKNTGGK
jgi:hypothetical protein